MKSKSANVFLGAVVCDECGLLSVHNAVPQTKDLTAVFVFTGVPAYRTVMRATCSHCGCSRKLRGEWKDYYKSALDNHFDNGNTVTRLLDKIKDISKRYNVVINGEYDKNNFNKAVDEIYRVLSIEYGYDREYYANLCELFSAVEATESKWQGIMFKSVTKEEKHENRADEEAPHSEVKQEKINNPLFKSF